MPKPNNDATKFSFDANGGTGGSEESERPDSNNNATGNAGDDANAIDGNAQSDGSNDARTTAEPPAQKRKGGWPKGKPRRPAGTADAASAARSANAGASARMDREKESVLAQQIVAFHAIAAMASGIPELTIDEREGALLARSVRELSAHYGPVVSGPAMLWMQFAGVAAMIYVPRVGAVAMRVQAMRAKRAKNITPKAEAPQDQGENVVQFPQGGTGATNDDPFRPGNIG